MRMSHEHAVPGKRRQAVNLTVDTQLIVRARALGINLSEVLEDALVERIAAREREVWRAENEESIAAHNARVERQGVYSDGIRRF